MAEVTRGPADFLSRVFRDAGSLRGAESGWARDDYLRAICAGGYPEARSLRSRVARSGQRASSFGDRIHALPVSALWGHAQAEHV